MSKETYNLETMTGAGKKMTLVGREYEVLPIKIEDMHYVIEENTGVAGVPAKKISDNGSKSWGKNIK